MRCRANAIAKETSMQRRSLFRRVSLGLVGAVMLAAPAVALELGDSPNMQSDAKEVEDLKGKRVAVLQGSSNEQSLRALNDSEKLGIDLVYAKDLGEGALLVASGRVDGFAADGGQIKVFAATKAQPKGS